MNLKNTFLRGTLLLTFAGVLSRFMGFFYRIFLANTIGAEGMGIYQLIFPIYGLCFSLCCSGIETAISKLTAEKMAAGKHFEAFQILKTGLSLSLILSFSCSVLIYCFAEPLAVEFLKDPRCTILLKAMAAAIPFGTAHSCIFGYYFGIHKAAVPSAAQLTEQIFRIGSVFLLYKIYTANHITISPVIAVFGLVAGEFCSFLFTLTCFSFHTNKQNSTTSLPNLNCLREIFTLAAPLTLSRILINLLGSLEATMIPNALKAYGMNHSAALSVYGILNGMALPFILFPTALTSSISLMLLPAVSELKAGGQLNHLKRTIKKTFTFCLFFGTVCLLFFLVFGNILGNFIFSNALAGSFIRTLAWICPFLYLNTTLNTVLNGLGRTDLTFFNGILSLFLRIGFIFFGVPKFGIYAYLLGLLASQLFAAFFGGYHILAHFKKTH